LVSCVTKDNGLKWHSYVEIRIDRIKAFLIGKAQINKPTLYGKVI